MTDVDELCALGFDRYWVNQALELTNHNKDYALEWLLSDEFKSAKKQFDEQKKAFAEKQTDGALPDAMNVQLNHNHNSGSVSLQESNTYRRQQPPSKQIPPRPLPSQNNMNIKGGPMTIPSLSSLSSNKSQSQSRSNADEFKMGQIGSLMRNGSGGNYTHPQQQHQQYHNGHNQMNNNFPPPESDEYDYAVIFSTSIFGASLYPDRDGKNCIIGQLLTRTAKNYVDSGSFVVAVNDKWVKDMHFEQIRDLIFAATKYPPFRIQFRMNSSNEESAQKSIAKSKNTERGFLKIKIVAGIQLKYRASYCVVQVGNARLSAKEVLRDENPEWNDMLTFKNFRPNTGKTAVINVFDHSTVAKDKKIGQTQYKLPTSFNKLQRDTLQLTSSKGKLSGIIIVNTIIVHKSSSNKNKNLRKY